MKAKKRSFIKEASRNRLISIDLGDNFYYGSKCKTCDGKKRYVRNNACVICYTQTGIPLDFEQRKKHMIDKLAAQARFKNIEFSITKDDIDWVEICPILGYKIDYWTQGKVKAETASFDRKNPNLGYIKGNVFIISNKANSVKSNMLIEQLERLIEYVKN